MILYAWCKNVSGMKQEEMSLVVDRDIISLSTAQESIYVADILEGSGLAFIISDYREILGAIDTEFLSKAVELVLENAGLSIKARAR